MKLSRNFAIIIMSLITIFFSLLNSINAQNNSLDSLKQVPDNFDNSPNFSYIAEQVDSLLNIWYVKQSISKNKSFQKTTQIDESVSFPDSIYANRLSQIPSIIPLTYNREVRSFIEMYCVKKRKFSGILVGLTKYYFPIYEEIMDFYGVPHELKYLSIIESALNPNAVSCVGATGLWQFMFSTGRQYGLDVNTFIDERKDIIKSTHAAARYLGDLYKIYNDWILAIAAYNCGPGNVNKAIRRANGKTNFWDIYYYLPRETRGYVPAYIAATYMMNYYDKHNIYPVTIDMPVLLDTVMVSKELHLQQVAAILNIPIEELKTLNPQYKRDIVPAYNQPYSMILPPNKALLFNSLRDSIHRYNYQTYFTPMQVVDIQSQKNNPALKIAQLKKRYHYVKKGETLKSISAKYGVSANEIKYMNKLRYNSVYPGRKLIVGYEPANKVSDTVKNKAIVSNNKDIKAKTNIVKNQKANTIAANNDQKFIYYKVNVGDTIWGIVKKFKGVTYNDIILHNKNIKKGNILPGQVLKIPKV